MLSLNGCPLFVLPRLIILLLSLCLHLHIDHHPLSGISLHQVSYINIERDHLKYWKKECSSVTIQNVYAVRKLDITSKSFPQSIPVRPFPFVITSLANQHLPFILSRANVKNNFWGVPSKNDTFRWSSTVQTSGIHFYCMESHDIVPTNIWRRRIQVPSFL